LLDCARKLIFHKIASIKQHLNLLYREMLGSSKAIYSPKALGSLGREGLIILNKLLNRSDKEKLFQIWTAGHL